jgi:branched-chain amino acid transport system ATP-binding protein
MAKMLSCIDVQKVFDGVCAVKNLSMSVDAGETCALIGPNGAGKTTLLNVLTGFLRPDAGRCYLGSVEITGMSPHRISALGLARTFQDLRIINKLSALENVLVAFPRQKSENIARAILHFGLKIEKDFLEAKARQILANVGLGGMTERLAGELSYGQQKLLTIGACIATEKSALLLDEPFAGVDPGTSEKLSEIFLTFRSSGKALLFIEHDIEAVRKNAQRVLVMNQGAIIADGPPRVVLERPDILEAYLV